MYSLICPLYKSPFVQILPTTDQGAEVFPFQQHFSADRLRNLEKRVDNTTVLGLWAVALPFLGLQAVSPPSPRVTSSCSAHPPPPPTPPPSYETRVLGWPLLRDKADLLTEAFKA